ncbi:MAG TPA: HAMP domain-containing sensor histidine kinase [Burkholderiaceae bacterium]|nr:HAMP domain-containing sensor histidine kinase [Burkholderiaceae bacterium]
MAVLLLFALVSGWIANRNVEHVRATFQTMATERAAAWAELIENSLPPATAPVEQQRTALLDWANRLRLPLALENEQGERIATSEQFARREQEPAPPDGLRRAVRVPLSDGRALWLGRPGGALRMGSPGGPAGDGPGGPGSAGEGAGGARPPRFLIVPPGGGWGFVGGGAGLAVALAVLFAAVAAGAYPVVRRLTRRLEALRAGVEVFGAGGLSHRVSEEGRDEVAAVASSFNRAAQRIEELVRANKSLLANASHELRSPLARMKMALSMLGDARPERLDGLKQEIHTDIAELDALVAELLLASRLDAVPSLDNRTDVDLLALAAEEGARVNANVGGEALTVHGDERLLRRALRNLLENARRYGGDEVHCTVERLDGGNAWPSGVQVCVCDRGPGVPDAMRERIFEPFFRLPGHAEHAGGVGLGLSLVKQIAERHGGSIRCEPREGGGSCFRLNLPRR